MPATITATGIRINLPNLKRLFNSQYQIVINKAIFSKPALAHNFYKIEVRALVKISIVSMQKFAF